MANVTARPRDNRSTLFVVAAAGTIAPPRIDAETQRFDREGRQFLLPGSGGVHPDVHVGDPVGRWLGDHLMVGASIENSGSTSSEPGPLHLLACVGNRVRDAAGGNLGVVAGKRGGLAPGFMPPHYVSVDAPSARLAALAPGATVVLEAIGRGLSLIDWPDVMLLNLSPAILDALPVREAAGRIEVGVRAIVNARGAGAGLGQDAWVGDLEVTDPSLVLPTGIEFTFGDLVAFDEVDARFGRYYRPGYVSIGIVSHGPSQAPGHGVGVTILISGPARDIAVVLDDTASLASAIRDLAGSHSPRSLAGSPDAAPSSKSQRTRVGRA